MIRTIFTTVDAQKILGPVSLEEAYNGTYSSKYLKSISTDSENTQVISVIDENGRVVADPMNTDDVTVIRQCGKSGIINTMLMIKFMHTAIVHDICDEVVILIEDEFDRVAKEMENQYKSSDHETDECNELYQFPNGGVLVIGNSDMGMSISKLRGSSIVSTLDQASVFRCPKCEEPAYDPLEEEKRINRLKSMHNRRYKRINKW